MHEIFKVPVLINNNNVVHLFRAVGAEEFYSIMRLNRFTIPPYISANVKYFGVDFDETLTFANRKQFVDIIAVFEVEVLYDKLMQIGDFTHIDAFLFKKGTVIIHSEHLDFFNNAIMHINHKY